MEHPHQYPLPGQPQGDGDHLHDGHGGGHPMFPRSLSYQDMLAGRVLPISQMASMPADMARSTDNIATLAPSDNNVKISHEVDHQAQLHHQTGGGRVRVPFPPVPKLDQLPGLPKVEAPPVMPLNISSATQLVYPPASGFGSITCSNPQGSQAQHQPYPPMPQGYTGPEGDPGWRVPQYKKRSDQPNPITCGGGGNAWVKTEMGPPQPPPPYHPGYSHHPMYPPHHGHGHPHQQQYHQHLGAQQGHMIWNNKDNRYMNVFDDCGSGLSRESSRDDINSECDQQFEHEQRFRVDRKKLETMMTNSPEFGEAAQEFFDRIGAETDTCVIWPSRLKIGAKSKKDPHIRVGGRTEESVMRAKMMITEVLDTTTNSRVTMKMDVSYTDHSHIIGKGGNTIRRVMAETNCHIHFPDSNRSNPNEKSNQVSIAGEMGGVERARARVRELTPLLFNFDLPIMPSFQSAPDTNSPYMRAIMDQYNVQIIPRPKQKNFHAMTIVVKGCEWECARVKEATLLLMEHLCKNNGSGGNPGTVPVFMTMEISPQHHATVLGKGNINLKIIMNRTNTTIIFPDAGDPNIPPIKKGSVTISSNSIHNVYLARQLLLGSLPIVMMFDIPESLPVDENVISKLQEDNDVLISIKPKARQSSKSCIIKTQERNSAGLYVARHVLLHLDRQNEPMIRADIPETYKVPLGGNSSNHVMSTVQATKGPFTSLYPPPASPHPLTPVYTPTMANTSRPPSPWHLPPPPPPTPVSGPGPGHHPFLQEYQMLLLNNINRLQQQQQIQQQEDHLMPNSNTAQSISPCLSQGNQHSGHGSSGMGSSLHSSPLRLRSPHKAGRSPRNSSPVNPGGNLTNNLHKLDLTSASSGIGHHSHEKDITQDISVLLSGMGVSDRRAPGCEKKDYEQKKLLATQAMKSKPMGEPRTPNSVWSGLGFSSSMPEAVIRERMEAEHARAKQQREKEIASNSDWFGRSHAFDSFLAPSAPGDATAPGLDELASLLTTQGLGKYTDVFLRHEVDLQTFATLTDEELKEIGIPTFGARKKLLLLAREIKKKFELS